MNEFVLKRGLKNIYAAEILKDNNETGEGEGYVTDTPFHLIPAGEMTRTVDSEKVDIFYDDTVFATVGREAATEIQITGAALRADALARINNKDVDSVTGAVVDSGEYAPKYFALGGEAENTDGTTEWFWFLKGTFSIPEQNDKTKDDTTDTNGMQLTFSAVQTQHVFELKSKVAKRVVIDTGITEVKSGKSWTAQVVTPDNLAEVCQKITPAAADDDDDD